MAKINFGGVVEEVVMREEFPLEKARQVLKDELVAVLGYGVQGPAQSLNMKDNGINVIIGQAPEDRRYWDKAVADGWVPGKTLFPIEEAVPIAVDTVSRFLTTSESVREVRFVAFSREDYEVYAKGFRSTASGETAPQK